MEPLEGATNGSFTCTSSGLIRMSGPLCVRRQGVSDKGLCLTVYLVLLVVEVGVFPLLPENVVRLVPVGDRSQSWTGDFCQRVEIQSVDHQIRSIGKGGGGDSRQHLRNRELGEETHEPGLGDQGCCLKCAEPSPRSGRVPLFTLGTSRINRRTPGNHTCSRSYTGPAGGRRDCKKKKGLMPRTIYLSEQITPIKQIRAANVRRRSVTICF